MFWSAYANDDMSSTTYARATFRFFITSFLFVVTTNKVRFDSLGVDYISFTSAYISAYDVEEMWIVFLSQNFEAKLI